MQLEVGDIAKTKSKQRYKAFGLHHASRPSYTVDCGDYLDMEDCHGIFVILESFFIPVKLAGN